MGGQSASLGRDKVIKQVEAEGRMHMTAKREECEADSKYLEGTEETGKVGYDSKGHFPNLHHKHQLREIDLGALCQADKGVLTMSHRLDQSTNH